MIETIQIKNFKSVVDLSLDLGTFNVLIGENGCGKSNILEAIAFGAAASADKLDYEFFGSRGIRATNPEFMFSAFSNGKKRKSITIDFQTDERDYAFDLVNETNNPKKWTNKNKKIAIEEIQKQINAIYLEDDEEKRNKIFRELDGDKAILSTFSDAFKPLRKEQGYIDFFSNVYPTILEKAFSSEEISNYIIYSPEQSSLRRFEETTQIYPLGIRGEGLFQYLKELALDKKSAKLLAYVKENLGLLDWYEGFDLPENLLKNETSLTIRDKYLHPSLQYFDQRSTNEGFLFLLFYSTLFISRTTPRFFAIDNIDASFNPKLCQQLTRNLASLAKKNKKQVIVTTQNPAILDGLNLKDNQQRLFVVRRNDEGHTKAKRIEYKADRTMKLSEVWTSGFIGGLPENF
jgi:predicted ATPase